MYDLPPPTPPPIFCTLRKIQPTSFMAWKTMGGRQFWTDREQTSAGRLQRHSWLPLCRVIDLQNHLLYWGLEEDCRIYLRHLALAAQPKLTVVFIHGLGRTRASMAPLAKLCRASGVATLEFGYASLLLSPAEASQALHEFLRSSQSQGRFILVGHSLGGLLGRSLLQPPVHSPAQDPQVQILSVLSLGTPHEGCPAANLISLSPLRLIAGPCIPRLGTSGDSWPQQLPQDPRLHCLAGTAHSHWLPWPPFISPSGDGLVPLSSAAPAWASSTTITACHTRLMLQLQSRHLLWDLIRQANAAQPP